MEQYLRNLDTSVFEITTRQRYTKFSTLFFKNDPYIVIPDYIVNKFITVPDFLIVCLQNEKIVYISKYYNTSFIRSDTNIDIAIMKHRLYTLLMKYNMEDLSEYIKINNYIFNVSEKPDIRFESLISGKFSIYESIEELPNLDEYFKPKSTCILI